MVALCFSTSFVVMSPLIDMATSLVGPSLRTACHVNGARPRTGVDRGERATTARTGSSVREDEWGRAAPFGRSAGIRRTDLQGRARPLRVGPTRRILDPAVVQV